MPDPISSPMAGPVPARAPAEVAAPGNTTDPRIRGAAKVAQAFEAAFLAEMLKHAGVGEAPKGFGGGVGEDQFAGFLREAQATEMAAAGGVGIAEYVMRHLAGTSMEEVQHDGGS